MGPTVTHKHTRRYMKGKKGRAGDREQMKKRDSKGGNRVGEKIG